MKSMAVLILRISSKIDTALELILIHVPQFVDTVQILHVVTPARAELL